MLECSKGKKKVSKVLQASFKGFPGKFQGCIKSVSKVLPGTFKSDSRKFKDLKVVHVSGVL